MICPICFSKHLRYFFQKDSFKFYCCLDCNLVFVWPIPEDLTSIYGEDYFKLSNLDKGIGYIDYDQDRMAMRGIFIKYIKIIKQYNSGKKLLDIGAARGYFMKLAMERGWQVSGIEISQAAAGAGRDSKFDILIGDFKHLSINNKYDVITMWDVLEHVADPLGYIKAVNKNLEPGGIFAFTTVDRGSLWAKAWGKKWQLFIPPEHLFYYSKKNLGILLKTNGFRIIKTKKIGRRNYLPYIFKMLFNWHGAGIWKRLYYYSLKNNFLRRIIIPVNLRDNIFILAIKEKEI